MRAMFSNDFEDQTIISMIMNGVSFYESILYLKYSDDILEHARIICGNCIAECEDLMQDTFVIAIENIRFGQYKHQGYLLTYLKKICKNLRYDACRKLNRFQKMITELKCICEEIDFGSELEKNIDYNEKAKIALSRLDKLCKELLEAYYYRRMSMREICQNFSHISTEHAARDKKYKCMKRLKSQIVI